MTLFILFCLSSLVACAHVGYLCLSKWHVVTGCPLVVVRLVTYSLYAMAMLVITVAVSIGVIGNLLSSGVLL